jgi:ribosome-associated protein
MKNTSLVSVKTDTSDSKQPKLSSTVRDVVLACLEARGRDIAILDVKGLSDLADTFVIVSGRSDRQVQGISNRVYDTLLELGRKPLAVDGLDKGQWVILDYGDLLVHVFYEANRSLYDLEGFWSKARRTMIKESIEDQQEGRAA